MKPDDFFAKFRRLRYRKDGKLSVEAIPKKVLWIDDDMLEGCTLGESVRKALKLMGAVPENVAIHYSGQDDALDELAGGDYSLIILDNDSYKGAEKGPATLKEIRKAEPRIPVVYTGALSPGSNYVADNIQEFVSTNDIPAKLPELLGKYLEVS